MGDQANRITVPLPSTLFDTKRSAEVDLPMTCNAPAITPRIVSGPILMWLVVGCSVIATFRGLWPMGVFAALMVPLAAAATTQIFARLLIGDQQIILGEEGLLDTRYGTVPVPWSAFRKATILYAKSHLLGVMLYYREPPATLPSMIGHLATSGWPFGLRQRMQVELKSVWNREIVASTIKFLVERHTVDQADTKRSWAPTSPGRGSHQ